MSTAAAVGSGEKGSADLMNTKTVLSVDDEMVNQVGLHGRKCR